MFLVFFAYVLAIIIAVLMTGLFVRAKKRKILIAIPVALIGIPAILMGLLFLFKEPLQRGETLANSSIGPLLNLISPPPDLYRPLGSIALAPEITEYTLSFIHKYVGHHALMVASPRPLKEDSPSYTDISVSMAVFDGQTELLEMSSEKIGQFWRREDYGAFLLSYKVPGNLPIARELTAKVKISGNLKGFLERRGGTVLMIQKVSDE
ncbi:MAG: hypothetical protein K8R55_03045 [Desulfuromonadaceae bacterium]|nr:hypothetical protein [Desulfuromonadaceae bacterium]